MTPITDTFAIDITAAIVSVSRRRMVRGEGDPDGPTDSFLASSHSHYQPPKYAWQRGKDTTVGLSIATKASQHSRMRITSSSWCT